MATNRAITQTIDDLTGFEFDDSNPGKPRKTGFSRVCWVVFWGNLGLALFKVTVGTLGYSPLLIIDGLNSAANAVVLTTIIMSIQMSHKEDINTRYPYGKGKVQYLLTLAVGVLLSIGASLVFALSMETLYASVSYEPTGIALATALISVAGNLMLLRFLKQTGLPNHKEELKRIKNLHTLNIAASTVVIQAILLAGIFGWLVAETYGGLEYCLARSFVEHPNYQKFPGRHHGPERRKRSRCGRCRFGERDKRRFGSTMDPLPQYGPKPVA